jgi:hypothetical protein
VCGLVLVGEVRDEVCGVLVGHGCGFYYFVGDLMALIDKACWERGCACYDDRIDKDVVEVVKREWVGLTEKDLKVFNDDVRFWAKYWEAKLKEKNT